MRKTPISDEQAAKLYSEYWEHRSSDDLRLSEIILDHEHLFDDMCLDGSSVIGDFVNYEVDFGNGFIEECSDHYVDLSSQYWRFYVRRMPDKNTAGYSRGNERIIAISPKHKDNLSIILHEMIHAHETVLESLHPFYREALILCLYRKLIGLIPDLYERVISHTHEINGIKITRSGGNHGVLFYLKSLDIDIKKGWPLGTTCGYGRDVESTQFDMQKAGE